MNKKNSIDLQKASENGELLINDPMRYFKSTQMYIQYIIE